MNSADLVKNLAIHCCKNPDGWFKPVNVSPRPEAPSFAELKPMDEKRRKAVEAWILYPTNHPLEFSEGDGPLYDWFIKNQAYADSIHKWKEDYEIAITAEWPWTYALLVFASMPKEFLE